MKEQEKVQTCFNMSAIRLNQGWPDFCHQINFNKNGISAKKK